MKLSSNFQLSEFTRSATAERLHIDNTPTPEAIVNLRALCIDVLQPLRDHAHIPIVITSGYRCRQLNAAVGGVARSQHLVGEAADIRIPLVVSASRGDDPLDVGKPKPSMVLANAWMDFIIAHTDFDQLILERDAAGTRWIHVSHRRAPARNRHQVIRM